MKYKGRNPLLANGSAGYARTDETVGMRKPMAILMKLTCAAEARHPVTYDPRSEWYKHTAAFRFCNEKAIIDGTGNRRTKPITKLVVVG
jgi:hypothetical protein